MSANSGPNIVESGLVLSLDPGNVKSLNIPTQSNHGYADWYCLVSATATYSIINQTGGIIYENNGGTITPVVTATGPQRGTFTVTAGRTYYGNVAINLVVEDSHHAIVPLTMMGTQFFHYANRSNPTTYYIYSPYLNATVNFYDNVATGIAGTPTSTTTVNAGQSATVTSNNLTYQWFSSNTPVIISATQSGWDRTILSPMAKYVYNRVQQFLNTTNNTVPTNNNAYVTYDSTYNVMNMTIADGSGGNSAQGLGLEYLSDIYSWGNALSDYSIVFPYNATVTAEYWNGTNWVVWDTHVVTSGSITNPPRITRDGTNGPGVEATNLSGTATNMASGATLWRWVGTAPFYLCINDNIDDELAMLGWMQSTTSNPRSSNIIRDISNNSNNGVLVNLPNFIYDKQGYLNFNGTNNYISINNNSSLSIVNSITLDVWIKINNFNNVGGILTYGSESEEQYGLWTSSSNAIVFSTNWPGTWYQGYSQTLSTNTWYNITSTFNSGNWKIYVNGTLNSSGTFAVSSLRNAANPILTVGVNHPGGDEYFSGQISGIKINNLELNASQVLQNFNALRGRYGI